MSTREERIEAVVRVLCSNPACMTLLMTGKPCLTCQQKSGDIDDALLAMGAILELSGGPEGYVARITGDHLRDATKMIKQKD